MSSAATLAKADKIQPLFDALESECSAYCVLAGYETLPDYAVSDIDFMVSEEDFARLPKIMQSLADSCGMSFVQFLQHETSACYYILASVDGATVTFLHPDASADYRRHGRLWMSAAEVLARRRKHRNGFWIPSPADGFIYYLLKRIDKRLFDQTHGDRLSPLYIEDPAGCREQVARLWPAESVDLICAAAQTRDWQPVIDAVARLADELMRYSPPKLGKHYRLHELFRKLRRVAFPTGLLVVFLGPDGVGKSTALGATETALAPAFRFTARFHLRPKLLRGSAAAQAFTAEPHSKPNRGALISIVKLIFLVADYTAGYWLTIRPLLVRSNFVLFDRYFYDLAVDNRRYRYGGPAWLVRVASHLIPSPDAVLVFDAPADVIHARKQELPREEIERQRKLYLNFAHSRHSFPTPVIDATRPLDEVLSQCSTEILCVLERRTLHRLHLAHTAEL